MIDLLKKNIGPLTWAYCIIAGGMLLTPDGPVPIIHKLFALAGIAIGAAGFINGAKRQ
jgi:hypothetical protein